MRFILAMDVLNMLFQKATEVGVFSPYGNRAIKFHCSIYTDDVILFKHPSEQQARAIKEILELFGEAAILRTNLAKCSITPIYGAAGEIDVIQSILDC